MQRGAVLRAYATHLVFLTMACISKYVLQVSSKQFATVPTSVQELSDFVQQVNQYSDDVCLILKGDSVLAQLDILLQELL